MPVTRILLVNMPGLLGEVVRGIVDQQAGMVIIGESMTSAELDIADVTDASVVVIGVDDDSRMAAADCLRKRHPHLRVLMIDVAGHDATMFEPDGRRHHVHRAALPPRRNAGSRSSPVRIAK